MYIILLFLDLFKMYVILLFLEFREESPESFTEVFPKVWTCYGPTPLTAACGGLAPRLRALCPDQRPFLVHDPIFLALHTLFRPQSLCTIQHESKYALSKPEVLPSLKPELLLGPASLWR